MFICWGIFTFLLMSTTRNPPVAAAIAMVITGIAALSWNQIK